MDKVFIKREITDQADIEYYSIKWKDKMENNNVSIGSTTIVGWLTSFLALLPTIIKSVEEGQVAFNGPEKYLAIFGIAAGLVTQVARYLQAHKLISVSSAAHNIGTISGFEESNPVTEEYTQIRPESAAMPDGPVSNQ